MSTPDTILDWQVMLDDHEWSRAESLQELLDGGPAALGQPRSSRAFPLRLRVVAGIVPLLALIAACLWYYADLGASRMDQEIHTVIVAETWSRAAASPAAARSLVDRQADMSWQSSVVQELGPTATLAAPLQLEVHDIALRPGMAMAAVTVIGSERPPYRELRFYRADPSEGWLRTAPDPGFWGPQQNIETDHFRLSFHRKDASTVLHAASRLDAIYDRLRQDAGLSPDTQKLMVVVSPVSVYQLPGLYFEGDRLVVHSPSLLQVPTDLPDEAILTQSIINPLVVHVLGEASPLATALQPWRPVVRGLLLWEAYAGSDALTSWYRDVVTWHYREVRAIHEGRRSPSPDDLALLCREYHIWRYALPNGLVPPWPCHDAAWRGRVLSIGRAPGQLNELLDVDDWEPSTAWLWTKTWPQTVAAATLVDYVVNTYGRDRLPALMAGFQIHDNWNTLSPAVFGVPAQELETGWQAYLADITGSYIRYGDGPGLENEVSGVHGAEVSR